MSELRRDGKLRARRVREKGEEIILGISPNKLASVWSRSRSPKEVTRTEGWRWWLKHIIGCIQRAQKQGATVHLGGERYSTQGYWVQPTIITNTRPEMDIVNDSSYGLNGLILHEGFEARDPSREQAAGLHRVGKLREHVALGRAVRRV
jgi:Aldehyde dehydrogenase family